MKDVEPVSPAEYILKGIVNAVIGQEQASVRLLYLLFIAHCSFVHSTIYSLACVGVQREHVKIAQQCFQIVGSSASECGALLNSRPLNSPPAPFSCRPRATAGTQLQGVRETEYSS